MMRFMLTAQRLKEVLNYSPETGVFRWAYSCPGISEGKIAGSMGTAYWRVMVDRREYLAHRLAWLWMTGQWPPIWIDHKDGDKLNNKWSNLRLASPSQSSANRPRNSNNSSGFKGVSWAAKNKKWMAMVEVNGHSIYLGLFTTPEAAHAAYVAAAKAHFGEFARAG